MSPLALLPDTVTTACHA